jgi:hypothetical protein
MAGLKAWLAAALCLWAGSADAMDSCSCKNLESLQQELENALYEASFFDSLSRRLDAIEKKQADLNKNDPTNANAGRLVLQVSADARKEIMAKEFKPPHGEVTGYTGPGSVDMEAGKCTQSQTALDAMRNGSPCQEIADITLEHESAHRKLCETMGADAYWARLPSQIAAEEAQRYKAQADAMRKQLKRVIDEGTITVEAIMEPRIYRPQFDVTYSYVTSKIELDGRSSPASDNWTLKGDGKQAGTIKHMKIAGMSCKASGQLNDDVSLSLDTDGLQMSLTATTVAKAGDIHITCKGGFGQSMRPQGESGSGSSFSGEPLKNSSEFVVPVSEMEFGKMIAQSGLSVSGELKTTVTLVCPGN